MLHHYSVNTGENKMKDLIKKAISLGLGIGAAGKDQAEKLASKVQKQVGMTKKDSKTFVNDMIKRGEKIRKNLDKQIKEMVDDAVETVENIAPVSRREFKDLEAQVKPKSAGKRKKTVKRKAKKTAKKTGKKTAKKTTKK
jgi:polyhydroxyalkanoate synthesis regulator phasin